MNSLAFTEGEPPSLGKLMCGLFHPKIVCQRETKPEQTYFEDRLIKFEVVPLGRGFSAPRKNRSGTKVLTLLSS